MIEFLRKNIIGLVCLLGFLLPYQIQAIDTNPKPKSTEYFRYEKLLKQISVLEQELGESEKVWKKSFEQRRVKFKEILQKLDNINAKLYRKWTRQNLNEDYKYVVGLWRSFVEDSFVNISGSVIERKLPEIITFDDFPPESELSKVQTSNLNRKYFQLKKKYRSYNEKFDIEQEKDTLYYNKILLSSGKLRSKIYQRLLKSNDKSIYEFTNENLDDLWREVRIIPIRWSATFYSKILEFRDHLNAGPVGYMMILKESSLLGLIILSIIIFIWFFNRMTAKFEIIAEIYLRKAYRSNIHWLPQYMLSLVNKIIPLLVLQLGLVTIEKILAATTISELAELIPYIEYYIIYRIAVVTTSYSITKLKSSNKIHVNYQTHAKILKSLTSFYKCILINMMVLHSIDAIVGKALIYGIFYNLYATITLVYSIYLVDRWRNDLFALVKTNLFGESYNIGKHSHRFYSPLISYLAFIYVILSKIYNIFLAWLDQFDFSKKISARLFQAQIRQAVSKEETHNFYPIPDSYIRKFSGNEANSQFLVEQNEFTNARNIIDRWIEGNDSLNNILLYGASGSGKTTFINSLNRYFNSKIYKHIILDSKITDPLKLEEKLNDILGMSISEILSGKKKLKEKLIISIDNAHNLFLAAPEDFEAIKYLLTIVNSKIENIFWIVSFHSFAWDHISRILESAQSFDMKLELESWSADEIEDLVMNRHSEGDYEISFDDIFFALEKDHLKDTMDYMKNKFFRLLWEQSDGNPTRSMSLWLSSLRFDGHDTLHVSIPSEFDSSDILNLGPNPLFVCAAILRHEFLSMKQIAKVTNQDPEKISYIVKACMKKRIILQDQDSNFRINPEYGSDIIRILKRKNYVY